MPPVRACTLAYLNAMQMRAMAQRCAPRPAAVSTEQYFDILRSAVESAQRTKADSRGISLVVRSEPSFHFTHMDVARQNRPKLRVTKEILACLFDLTVKEAMETLRVHSRVMRRLREWAGISRWPRDVIYRNDHPVLTLERVRMERIKLMGRAVDSDPYLYELLYAAHKAALCSVEGLPRPREFLDFAGERGRFEVPQAVAVAHYVESLAQRRPDEEKTEQCEAEPPRIAAERQGGQEQTWDFDAELADYLGCWDDSEPGSGLNPFCDLAQ